MSKFFMYGTFLEGIEKLMMMAPNFIPRRSVIVIQNYFNREGGIFNCDCCEDNERSKSFTNIRINLEEKLEGDKIKNKDLIKASFRQINNNDLRSRLKILRNKFKGEIFLNQSHKDRFYGFIHKQDINIYNISPRYIATIFLLTADEMLWELSEGAVNLNGINFSNIRLRQISTEGYALYQTAKTISTGKECIRTSEIADEDLINDTTFKAIINASLITRFGADIFNN